METESTTPLTVGQRSGDWKEWRGEGGFDMRTNLYREELHQHAPQHHDADRLFMLTQCTKSTPAIRLAAQIQCDVIIQRMAAQIRVAKGHGIG